MFFWGYFLCRFLRLAGGAGARAHLEKAANGVEGVALFACRPFALEAEKSAKEDVKRRKKELENASKKECRKTTKNSEMSQNGSQNRLRRRLFGVRRRLGQAKGSQKAQKARKKKPRAAQERPKRPQREF